jgi:hypothetical protein
MNLPAYHPTLTLAQQIARLEKAANEMEDEALDCAAEHDLYGAARLKRDADALRALAETMQKRATAETGRFKPYTGGGQ